MATNNSFEERIAAAQEQMLFRVSESKKIMDELTSLAERLKKLNLPSDACSTAQKDVKNSLDCEQRMLVEMERKSQTYHSLQAQHQVLTNVTYDEFCNLPTKTLLGIYLTTTAALHKQQQGYCVQCQTYSWLRDEITRMSAPPSKSWYCGHTCDDCEPGVLIARLNLIPVRNNLTIDGEIEKLAPKLVRQLLGCGYY